jgi:hypothetical protein
MDWAGFRAGLSSYTQAPDFWGWVYVIFAVSNAMFPSESDRESWGTVLVFLGVLAAVVYLSGWVTQISEEVISVLLNLARYLAYAFALTVVVDVVFAIVIALFEKLLGTLKGVTVQY